MADDAFALSPIHARPAQPTEADYDAISAAFMETARGRWFLGEYARRNRNADTKLVLDAVARMEAALANQKRTPETAAADLLPAINEAIAETGRALIAALPKADAKPPLEPIQRAATLLRDVAWTLRESGAETRVCDLLDVQAKIIADGCLRIQAAPQANIAAIVAAKLDTLAMQIAALAKDGALAPSRETAAAPRGAEAATARAEPEPASAEAVSEHRSEPIAADDGGLQAAQPATEPAAPAAPETAHDLVVGDSSPGGAAPPTAVAVTGEPAAEVTADPPAPAEPDPAAAPEAPPLADTPIAGIAMMEPSQTFTPPADDPIEASPARPASLGEAALARGVVIEPHDPLSEAVAAIRRMSQAERIAFFS